MTFDTIFQDEHILIVEKPSLLLSVPGRGPDKLDSLSYRIQQKFPHALIVHRLDWETSGLMVFALTKESQRSLNRQFEQRLVKKEYECRVMGKLIGQGEIDVPMMKDWINRPKQMVSFCDGKASTTFWKSLEVSRLIDKESQQSYPVSRIKLFPITGRSHQLRIHMLYISHPILGDPLYTSSVALNLTPRLQLHASKLSFFHPETKEWLSFSLDCPF